MDYSGLGIIVDYKYRVGPKAGKCFRTRFECVETFVAWCEDYDNTGIVEILNTKVVDKNMLYWDDRWVEQKSASV